MPHRPAGPVRPCPRKPPWHVTDATILTGGHHTDSAAKSCQTSYLCAPSSQSLTPRSSRPDTAGAQRTSVANGNETGGDTEPYRSRPHGRTSGPVSVAHTAPGHRPPLSPGSVRRLQRPGHLCAAPPTLEEVSATAEDNAGTPPREIRGYQRLPVEEHAATPNRGRTQKPALAAAETGFGGTTETGTVLKIWCCDPLSRLVL